MQHVGALERRRVVRHWLNAYMCLCEIRSPVGHVGFKRIKYVKSICDIR